MIKKSCKVNKALNNLSIVRRHIYFAFDFFLPGSSKFFRKFKSLLIEPIDIRYLQLSLTYDCQCSCLHCGMNKYARNGEKLLPSEIFSLINSLVDCGFGQIDFFGGEPLLDKNIYRYIDYASGKGIFTHINTNGILLNIDNVNKLYSAGLKAVSISFDSAEPREHDSNRGYRGAFELAMQGAKLCIEKKIKTIMSVYSSPSQIKKGETEMLIKIAQESGFNSVRLLFPFRTGKLSELEGEKFDIQELNVFISSFKGGKDFIKTHGISNCFLPFRTVAYVSPYGDVQPCSMTPFKFGNIKNEKLSRIINRMRRHPLFNIDEPGCVMNSKYIQSNFYHKAKIGEKSLPIPIEEIDAP